MRTRHATFLLAPLLVLLLAGCVGGGGPGLQGYGAVYQAKVTDAEGCTVLLPFPVQGTAPWGGLPLEPDAGTQARTVERAGYGWALELAGPANLGLETSWTGTSPPNATLSMQQEPYEPRGNATLGTHWVHGQGCAGARLELAWAHDAEPVGQRIVIAGVLQNGWNQMAAAREALPN